jgi:uncharacterized integral membrane protein
MSEPALHEPHASPAREVSEVGMFSEPPAAVQPPTAAAPLQAAEAETRGARFIRMAHRTRLHIYALVAVALLVYVVALATSNTGAVKVNWVFASSKVPLVWLTLFAAILGWLLGILITILFRLRTRAPLQRAAAAGTEASAVNSNEPSSATPAAP